MPDATASDRALRFRRGVGIVQMPPDVRPALRSDSLPELMIPFTFRPVQAAVCLALASGACSHTPPGDGSETSVTGPLSGGTPLQLTLNPGEDSWPAWSTDGASLWYTYEDLSRGDQDHCLGQLPAAGGERLTSFCRVAPPAADDSLDVAVAPAPRGNRLAWVAINNKPGAIVPDGGDLFLASGASLAAAVSLVHFPRQPAPGVLQTYGTDLQWLDDSTLIYSGTQMTVIGSPPTDTMLAGAGITLVHVTGAGATLTDIPGTDDVSSVAVGTAAGEIYFTRVADPRIFRMRLPDTTAGVVYDFSGSGPVRDVRCLGTRLLAVLGGTVNVSPDGQQDLGGTVYLLESGTATPLTTGGRWHHPVFRPDGNAFAAAASISGAASDIYVGVIP